MSFDKIDYKQVYGRDPSGWDPPTPAPTKDARTERLHADALHAETIDNLPWHPPACGYENIERVAACTNTPIPGGTLFIKGKGDIDEVDPNDIKQEQLGDCYLFAAAAAMAQTPEGRKRIHDMIKEKTVNGKTVYEVTFREPISRVSLSEGFPSPGYREVTVQVPADKFIQGHAGVGDRKGKEQEIWPLVLEAGYAKYKDGYQHVGNGGFSVDAFTALTGREARFANMPLYSEAQLKSDFLARKPMVMSIVPPKPANGPAPTTVPKYNLHSGHAYAVSNVFQKNGETYVQLKNPWGEADPKPIPLRELQRLQALVETGEKPDV